MKEEIVPKQEQGSKVDIEFKIQAPSRSEAVAAYNAAVHRLLNVNEWEKLCAPVSARFEVVDPDGLPVNMPASRGFYFRISIPGPGTIEGDGFDWVRVEMIKSVGDVSRDAEQISMRVRPSANPQKDGEGSTAHFFSSDATSTFQVTRIGLDVAASVHGRNETANAEAGTVTDAIRNVVVSLGARAGFSSLQWNSLVKGIIEGAPA
jgi:hypothetical protein